jgi:hypothetical protein
MAWIDNLQCQPTINLFIQNMPRKVSNAIECGIKNDSNASFQNPTSMHRTSNGIAFQNSA